MSLETVRAVEALERECFAVPWSLDSLTGELSNPLAVCYTASLHGILVGYAGMHHVLDEGHITNIAVTAARRKQGVASALLRALLRYAEENGLRLVTLEVRASNEAAIALYRSHRFEPVGVRKGYYRGPAEDAVIMTRNREAENVFSGV